MVELRGNRGLASKAKAARLPSRREVLQTELRAERRRLGHLVHQNGLPTKEGATGASTRGATTAMILLLSYKIRDLAAELAALDSTAAHARP